MDDNMIQRLQQQQQRISEDLNQSNSTVRNFATQFMALQQQSLQHVNRNHMQRDSIPAPATGVENASYSVDQFSQGSLQFSRRMINMQLLQQAILDLAEQGCENKQEVSAFAKQWSIKRVNPAAMHTGQEAIEQVKEFEPGTWQRAVAAYATCTVPFLDNKAELTDQVLVGYLVCDIERFKRLLK